VIAERPFADEGFVGIDITFEDKIGVGGDL
jgi:hypothetical protein